MIVLKSEVFISHSRLARFVNENHIQRGDIVAITDGQHGSTIYFYADDSVEEVTHGMFS